MSGTKEQKKETLEEKIASYTEQARELGVSEKTIKSMVKYFRQADKKRRRDASSIAKRGSFQSRIYDKAIPRPVLPPRNNLELLRVKLDRFEARYAWASMTPEDYETTSNQHVNAFADKWGALGTVIAIVGGVASAAMAAGSSGGANDTTRPGETVSWVRGSFDGKPFRGWLGARPPFQAGDKVEMVAAWQNNHYEVYAIANPQERIVSMCPKCVRGTKAHWISSFKWWLVFYLPSLALVGAIPFAGSDLQLGISPLSEWLRVLWDAFWFGTVCANFVITPISIALSIQSRNTQVALAEKIMTLLGMKNVPSIDLRKYTRKVIRQQKKQGTYIEQTPENPRPSDEFMDRNTYLFFY